MKTLGEKIKNKQWWNAGTIRIMVLCFFAATAFWFLNALNSDYSTTVKYPLNLVYDTEQYIATKELPDNVQINISGLGWNLFRNNLGIKVTPLSIPLESPAQTKKISGASLTGFLSDQLGEFELNYVLTDTLYFNIDRRISKTFMLAVDSSSINLDNNFRLIPPFKLSSNTTVLTGPSSVIESLSDTIYLKLPDGKISDNYEENVPVNFDNSELVRRNPPSVMVAFQVEEYIRAQQLVPLKTLNFPEKGKAYIERNSVLVDYFVALNRKDEVTADKFEIIADYNTIDIRDSTIIAQVLKWPNLVQQVVLDTTLIKVQFNE